MIAGIFIDSIEQYFGCNWRINLRKIQFQLKWKEYWDMYEFVTDAESEVRISDQKSIPENHIFFLL